MDLNELIEVSERAYSRGEWLQSIAASNLVLAKQSAASGVLCGETRQWVDGKWPCVLPNNHPGAHKDVEGDSWN